MLSIPRGVRCPARHRRPAGWLLVLATLCLAGCGWQLRGGIEVPPELRTMHLTGAVAGDFGRALSASLETSGIDLVDGGQDAAYTVELLGETFDRRPVSIDERARTAQYRISLDAGFRVLGAGGEVRIPATRIRADQTYRFDRDNSVAASEEEALLRAELVANLVRQLARRIEYLAEADSATASAAAAGRASVGDAAVDDVDAGDGAPD